MPLFEKYLSNAPQVVSEQPADTLPEGHYPGKVINARLEAREGTSQKTGAKYAFGEPSLQIQVSEGPLKGQTTWVRATMTLPDPTRDDGSTLDDTQISRLTYFVQKFYDATGFGLKLDPSWKREEKPNPRKPGKTMTVFKGKVLTRDHLLAIAKNQADKEQFEKICVGLTGIWSLGEREFDTQSGEKGTAQSLKGVEPLTEAGMVKWRTKQSEAGQQHPAAAPTSSIYGG